MSKSQKWWKNFDKSKQFKFEDLLIHQGCEVIGGIDEVAMGPIAGPTVAAVVILDLERIRSYSFQFGKKQLFPWDSKGFDRSEREALLSDMRSKGLILKEATGWVSAEEINKLQNMNSVRVLAWKRAAEHTNWEFEAIISDFFVFKEAEEKGLQNIHCVKADQKSVSVGTASLVAKVAHDHYMQKIHKDFPMYNWAVNMGYSTIEHLKAVKEFGASKHHRTWYNNVQTVLKMRVK